MNRSNSPITHALLLLLLLLSLTYSTQAQDKIQTIEPAYLSVADGVASPTVNAVIQDSFGLIWIGTANGLQKYDGYKFQTFKNIPGNASSLQNNFVWALLEDDNHDIWVSNNRGVSKYIRKTNEFKNYDFAPTFNFTPNSEVAGFKFLIDSQNRLWLTSITVQLALYDPGTDAWNYANYELPNAAESVHTGFSPALAEDHNGDLWLSTPTNGLMRQKKLEKAFKPVPTDKFGGINFVDDDLITGLYADQSNTLWMTTRNGVYKYDIKTETFKTLKEYESRVGEIWNNWNMIAADPQGNIWISNNFRGMLKFDGISDHYTEIEIAGKVIMRTYGWNITLTQFMIDQSGIFWIGSRESGLVKYDPVNKPFQYLGHDVSNPNSLSAGGVFGIQASKITPGRVYVGSRGNGLTVYDPLQQSFERVTFKVEEDFFGGSARSIAEASDGSLWLGTWGDGVIELDKNYKEIRRYKTDSTDENTISNNQVRALKPDGKGQVWIGTNSGLNILDTKTNTIKRVASKQTRQYPDEVVAEVEKLIATDQKIASIEKIVDNQNLSESFEISKSGTYWLMAVGEIDGVSRADYGWIENEVKDTVWLMGDFDHTYYAGGDPKNRVELGSVQLEPGKYTLRYLTDDSHAFDKWNADKPNQTALYGIAVLNSQDGNEFQFLQTPQLPEQEELVINGINVNDIEIAGKYVWVATAGTGLDRIDPATNQVKHFAHDPLDNSSLIFDNILDIHADSQGMIWLATQEGLNKLDPATDTFIRYTEADGLATNLIQGIVEGDDGEMWIASQSGLSQMVTNENLGKITFINYNSSDGLGADVFLSLASTRAADGRFYFGGEHGLTTFSSISSNKTPPSIIISNLFISNKSIIDMKENSPLTESLLATESITLDFYQNNLAFEFAALHYANPQKNQYAHMLKGYDEDWIYDNRNFVGYTNLDPGEYELLVRASNAYGIWNEEGKSLKITILAPWWKTWWAYLSYVFIAGLLAVTIGRVQRRRVVDRERQQSAIREANFKAEAQKERRKNIELISEIGKDITSSLSIQNIINTVYLHVNKLMDASVFGIGIFNKTTQSLEFPATKENGTTLPAYTYSLDDKNRPASWCYKNKKEILSNDFENDHHHYIEVIPAVAAGDNTQSLVYLPLINKDKIVGVLTAQSFEKNAYTDFHLEILRSIATYAALAIDNAEAYRNLKSTQAQLIQSEKMASLGELTAGIAHEIQNPLNFVNNFSEVSEELIDELKEELADGNSESVSEILAFLKDNISKINHHGKRADSIVKGMLQHSRKSEGKKESTDLNQLAEECLGLSYHGLRAKDKSFQADFKTDLEPNLPKVEVIRQDLGRVLLNLINNAFYAVDEKAKSGTASPDYQPRVTVSNVQSLPVNGTLGQIQISVSDNGHGIPETIKDKIFQPFFTTKPAGSGTGLGLSLSYDIVRAHGGELKVETTAGEGSVFMIQLPVV
ncbi:hypothetical protein GCM10009119_05150 [Algoriphagus jejuensis]|uniref:histidine kinase n=1 Tax=Algoriphagus jejuensis TaxID=419934 RepID=A0ABN1MWH6_9BACT